jgi:hypothetical protein
MVKESNMSTFESARTRGQLEHIGAAIRANEQQVGGAHYADKAIQPWDYIVANNLGYLEGNVVKYVSRWKDKGGVEDLKKAQHYLAKLLELYDR